MSGRGSHNRSRANCNVDVAMRKIAGVTGACHSAEWSTSTAECLGKQLRHQAGQLFERLGVRDSESGEARVRANEVVRAGWFLNAVGFTREGVSH